MTDHVPTSPTATPSPWLRSAGRSAAERIAAALGLVAVAPILAICAIVVRLESRGGAFYRQIRVGRDGRPFRIVKLRTMVADAEADSGPVWSVGHDPRVTAIGRFLRRSHLDELPQLWNVVRGEMSLVGPRPERPVFTERLARELPRYAQRHRARPGITGLAQISQGPDASVDDVARKLALDLRYLEAATPWLDVLILARTFLPGPPPRLPARRSGGTAPTRREPASAS
ncbi:MAG: sugar transferase [Planctomycetota bacterium]